MNECLWYGVELSISWEFWQNISGWKFVVGVPFFMIYCFGRKFQILVSVKMNLWWTFYYFLKNLTWKNVKNVSAFKWIFQNIDLSMEFFFDTICRWQYEVNSWKVVVAGWPSMGNFESNFPSCSQLTSHQIIPPPPPPDIVFMLWCG